MLPTSHDWRAFLGGIWRDELPPLSLDVAAWERLAPALSDSRAAALAWRRLKHSPLAAHPLAAPFRQQHRAEFLRARLMESQIEWLLQTFADAEISVVPVKGWLCARHYAQLELRPAGDIDLCVRAADMEAATATLLRAGAQRVTDENLNRASNQRLREEKFLFPDAPLGWFLVELHAELTDLHAPAEPAWDALLARGETVAIGENKARVLAPEDHLRLLAIHLLRHEAARPLWLCDIGAVLEARGDSWNWKRCLGRDRTRRNWVITALLLARELTGVSLRGAPFEKQKLPHWLVPHVVAQWNAGHALFRDPDSELMWNYLRAPARLWHEREEFWGELKKRWPAPIAAAVGCRHVIDNSPRLSWQLRYCARLGGNYLAHLPDFLRRERAR